MYVPDILTHTMLNTKKGRIRCLILQNQESQLDSTTITHTPMVLPVRHAVTELNTVFDHVEKNMFVYSIKLLFIFIKIGFIYKITFILATFPIFCKGVGTS